MRTIRVIGKMAIVLAELIGCPLLMHGEEVSSDEVPLGMEYACYVRVTREQLRGI